MYVDYSLPTLQLLTVPVTMENAHLTNDNRVFISDFYIHLETTCSNSKTFDYLIEAFDLMQEVNFPTYIHGHTADLVYPCPIMIITRISTSDVFSDHFSISFTLILTTPRSQTDATVIFRKNH